MQPANQEECFSNLRQDFLVCTTVHKARHLGTFVGEVLCRVTFDKIQKTTRVVRNTENPFFNEYFVFELNTTLNELLRQTVFFEVIQKGGLRGNATLGELHIDMHSVWMQPNRYFFKKWGRLEAPLGKNAEDMKPKGYLQIDLAIITNATNTELFLQEATQDKNVMDAETNREHDDIKNSGPGQHYCNIKIVLIILPFLRNMLTNIDPKVECNIKYTISFYSGHFVKKSDYFVQFIHHPFKGKTNVCKSTASPQFNEFVSFTWIYPSLTQTFLIQIFTSETFHWKCIAEYELHFSDIAFKDKPKLGPTFLHFYDIANPSKYIGRLLLEILSECLTEKIPPRELTIGKVMPTDQKIWWQNEIFTLEFLALYGDFLHGGYNNCKITMKLAEHTSNSVEFVTKNYQSDSKVVKKLKYFTRKMPYKAISITADMPDNRHKYDSDYFLEEIIDFMKTELDSFKLFQLKYTNRFQMQNKCLKSIIQALQGRVKEGISKKRLQYTNFKDPTPWDINRLFYLQEVMRVLPEELREMIYRLRNTTVYTIEHTMSDVVQQLTNSYKELSNITYSTRVQDDWPELFLVLSSGGKDVALCRVNPKLYLNTPINKHISPINACWQVRHFVFKDINCRHMCNSCGCIAAIIQGCLGVLAESEHNDFLDEIVEEWQQVENFYYSPTVEQTTFKLRLFIYQAKVRPGHDKSGLCDGFVRVLFNGRAAETKPIKATLSPTWNVVICFECLKLPGSIEWYYTHPPVIAVEFYDLDTFTTDDYLGCGLIPCSVISSENEDKNKQEAPSNSAYWKKYQRLKELSPPPLKWLSMAVEGTIRAEVLISAELIAITECEDSEEAAEPTISLGIPLSIRPNMKNFVLEVVFVGFRNYMKSFSGRHRVKMMMGDLLLHSGLTTSRMKNSINFLVLYASGVVSLPEQLEYWPAIIITDVLVSGKVDSSKFSETPVGAMLIPDSKRYLQREKFITCLAKEDEIPSTPHTTVEDKIKSTFMQGNWIPSFIRRMCLLKKPSKERCKTVERLDDSRFTWWTKFYNSMHVKTIDFNCSKHSLTIFNKELERYPEYSYFHDWAEPIVLVHGVKIKKNTVPKEESYATLKLHIKITPCHCNEAEDSGDESTVKPLAAALNPQYQAQVQVLAELCRVVVRVYVVQGLNFRPFDKTSESDTYVKIRVGNKSQTNRAHYIPNQSNPIFGKVFQLEGVLPSDHLLEISVYDRNSIKDDLIGSTIIDLEDRWRTQHRATVGLPNEYCKDGYNKWRDIETPYEILTDYCFKRQIQTPKFEGNMITIDGASFKDETEIALNEDMQERLSLTALKNFEKLPSFRYKLIPEHVETRSLYRSSFPGIEQGKIQLWVELYDGNMNIPPPMDITPEPPHSYELRVTVYNCSEIIKDDTNIFGVKMSDIYVKGWCDDFQKAQLTDVHYRSLNGEGMFNWRMIFKINYSATEDMMITKRKMGVFDEYESKQPPILNIQVWDNDVISDDDFLGALEINLSNFPTPYTNSATCNAATLEFEKGWRRYDKYKLVDDRLNTNAYANRKSINLFRAKKAKGWFPLRAPYDSNAEAPLSHYAGKIELELEIYDEFESAIYPAGIGRSEPNALPPPKRPDTSFNPLKNPLKSLKLIVWPVVRRYGFIILAVMLALMLIVITISDLPLIIKSLF